MKKTIQSVMVAPSLTAEDKRRIVDMLDKACPGDMAEMRLEQAKINFGWMQARANLALAEVEVARHRRLEAGEFGPNSCKAMGEPARLSLGLG
jgi:hypothetical protein